MKNTLTSIIKTKDYIFNFFRIVGKKRLLIFSITFFSLCVLISSSVLAYSIKLKSDGDKEYKGQNYNKALKRYELSQKYWFPELINYKFRDRDLHTKIDKAKIMVDSGENYNKGISAFANKQYTEAKQYLSFVVAKDPYFPETEKMLEIIDKQLAPSPNPVKVVKSTPLTNKQEETSNNTSNTNNSAGTDWIKFEKDLKEKLKNVGTNSNQEIQPSPTSNPTPSYNDLHCPKIVKLEDNLGNTSISNYLKGTFRKGSINSLAIKITATDPQNLPLYYQYSHTGFTNLDSTVVDWSTNNSLSVDVTNASPGSSRVISVHLDNQDKYGCTGSYIDAVGQFNYDITP